MLKEKIRKQKILISRSSDEEKSVLLDYLIEFVQQPFVKIKMVTPPPDAEQSILVRRRDPILLNPSLAL